MERTIMVKTVFMPKEAKTDTAELILQTFSHLTYVTAHSPTLPSLYLRHNSFSNPSVAPPTSQLILQPLFRFSYVTGFSLTSPGEAPMAQVHTLKTNKLGININSLLLDYFLFFTDSLSTFFLYLLFTPPQCRTYTLRD